MLESREVPHELGEQCIGQKLLACARYAHPIAAMSTWQLPDHRRIDDALQTSHNAFRRVLARKYSQGDAVR